MTAPLDLDALSAALAKATPGPYRQGEGEAHCTVYEGTRRDVSAIAVTVRMGSRTDEEGAANAALIVALINAAPQMIAEITALREEQGRAMQAFGESLLADVADALDEANAPGLATATRQLAKQKVAASIAALNLEGAAS